MTTSPRVALCVVLGSWGALLVAAGVAGERQSHSSSHRLCQTRLCSGIEIHGANALAGIHLDYLYTDDACGQSAPLSACGMTVCQPFDRPADLVVNKSPAPLDDYSETYGNYSESYDDEEKYYEVLDEIQTPAAKIHEPSVVSDSLDDVYYDDLRGAYIPSAEAHRLNAADDDWNEGAQGWYADPQDTDDLDANIWATDAPNVDAPQPKITVDLPYYGEYDPCDDSYSQHHLPPAVQEELMELAVNSWHSIGQAWIFIQQFVNDALPPVQVSVAANATVAASPMIAHLTSIETTPKLPGWMYGDFAFDEDWRGCDVLPHSPCELEPYPAYDRAPAPAVVPDAVWTENRTHSANTSIWTESDEDYCHCEFDCESEVEHAISLAVRREIVRLAMIPVTSSTSMIWGNYRTVWNDVAASWQQFAHEVAVIAQVAKPSRASASAKRPVRTQHNLHLGL